MKNFLFDAECVITIRVDAKNEKEARIKVAEQIDGEGWTQKRELDLIEVDGECPGAIQVEGEEEATQAGLYQA